MYNLYFNNQLVMSNKPLALIKWECKQEKYKGFKNYLKWEKAQKNL